jgi:hypothetical protein
MSEAWTGRLDQLLYDGETVETEVSLGTDEVVVTTHRVLAFSPSSDGDHFETVDLPNVVGVDTDSGGQFTLLRYGLWGIVPGLGLAIGGAVIEVGSLFELPSTDSSGTGLGSTLSTMQRIFDLFALVDELMLYAGLCALCVGLLLVAGYGYTYDYYLTIAIAGETEDIQIPLEGTSLDDEILADLETAIFPDGEPPDDGSIFSTIVE